MLGGDEAADVAEMHKDAALSAQDAVYLKGRLRHAGGGEQSTSFACNLLPLPTPMLPGCTYALHTCPQMAAATAIVIQGAGIWPTFLEARFSMTLKSLGCMPSSLMRLDLSTCTFVTSPSGHNRSQVVIAARMDGPCKWNQDITPLCSSCCQ